MQAQAAVLEAPSGPWTIETIQLEPPGPGQVMVQITAAGICHTDLIFASGAMNSPFPLVLGHEGAGVIHSVGPGVSDLAPGDKVLLTFDSCGACPCCAAGEPSYCHSFLPLNFAVADVTGKVTARRQNGAALSTRFFGQSSFGSHAVANRRNVLKIDARADETILAPLGCGIQTGAGAVLRSLKARPGSDIVVMGGGAVGLSAIMAARIANCREIILIEPNAERRKLAQELGATRVIDPIGTDTTAAVRAICPAGVANVLDTSGNMAAIGAAIGMLAPHGALGLVGVPGSLDAVLPLPIVPVISAGFRVIGIIEGDSDPASFLPELLAHHAAGRLPVGKLVRHYPFDQIATAIDDAHHGRVIKAVLTF
ncbi:MAG: NAD(P)-dependent alcohol dehydrogenase [Paracoccaceae bacterium]